MRDVFEERRIVQMFWLFRLWKKSYIKPKKYFVRSFHKSSKDIWERLPLPWIELTNRIEKTASLWTSSLYNYKRAVIIRYRGPFCPYRLFSKKITRTTSTCLVGKDPLLKKIKSRLDGMIIPTGGLIVRERLHADGRNILQHQNDVRACFDQNFLWSSKTAFIAIVWISTQEFPSPFTFILETALITDKKSKLQFLLRTFGNVSSFSLFTK